MLLAGMSRIEMSINVRNTGMMGYGQPHNTVHEQATPIYARSLFVENSDGERFVWVTAEICFITVSIRNEVIKRIQETRPEFGLREKNIILAAQHTHSAPGGYSHFPLYNFSIPGFIPEVFEAYVCGIVKSIVEAVKNKTEALIKFGEVTIPYAEEVAFNRSLRAYNQNPEVDKLEEPDASHGVDRVVTGIKIEATKDQKLIGLLSWFGVHATSISSFNHKIHSDNKGVASSLLEKRYPGSVMIMAQKAAGDISPNFTFDKKLKRVRGKFADQYESCEFNGDLQANWTEKALKNSNTELDKKISSDLCFVDVPAIEIDLDFTNGRIVKTAEPALGVAFFEGAPEGPGVPKALGNILGALCDATKLRQESTNKEFYLAQGSKKVLLNARTGEFLGGSEFWKYLPVIGDLTIQTFIRQQKNKSLKTKPWVPSVLPLQWLSLGNLFVIVVPGEITHIAAKRLVQTAKSVLAKPHLDIIVASYANAYMGYITTPEEYEAQCYEGGHTLYGQWTLPAMQTALKKLLRKESASWIVSHAQTFPKDEILLRSFKLT